MDMEDDEATVKRSDACRTTKTTKPIDSAQFAFPTTAIFFVSRDKGDDGEENSS